MAILVIFFLKEVPHFFSDDRYMRTYAAQTVTRQPRKAVSDVSAIESHTDSAEAAEQAAREAPVPLRGLLTRPVLLSVSSYGLLAALEMAYLALLPVFYSSAIEYGGLGLPPSAIGIILGVFGLTNGVFQALFFSRIVLRLGVKRLLMTAMAAFVPLFAMFPLIHFMARQWGTSPVVWVAIALQIAVAIVMDMAYSMCLSLYYRTEH